MKSRTQKRARQEREYSKLRAVFLAANPRCARCGHGSEQVHHKRGRIGALLTAVEHWLAVCGDCHRYITENPAAAYEQGWSERRVGAA